MSDKGYPENLEAAADRAEELYEENEELKAAIATPEVYAGVVSDVVERDFSMQVKQLREENERLRKIIENADCLLSDAQPNDRVVNRNAWAVARTNWFYSCLEGAEDEG